MSGSTLPTTECQLHAEQQAAIDNLTNDVRNLSAEQRRADTMISRQDEMNGRIISELSTTRSAAVKASEAAVSAVTIVKQLDAKWDRKHEEIVGRVALLEDKAGDGGPPPAVPSVRASLPSYDEGLLSENTQTNLIAGDKEVVFSAFLRERETTAQLRADVAAMQARLDEKQRQSDRARQEATNAQQQTLQQTQQKRAWTFGWGKLIITAIVSVMLGGGGTFAACNALRSTPTQHLAPADSGR